MTLGKIYCKSFEQFMDALRGLVERGLTFEADADKLIIELTGGF